MSEQTILDDIIAYIKDKDKSIAVFVKSRKTSRIILLRKKCEGETLEINWVITQEELRQIADSSVFHAIADAYLDQIKEAVSSHEHH